MQWVVGATPEINQLSNWRSVVGVCFSFTLLMMIVVGTRLWVRRHQFYFEDVVITVTALFSIMFNIGTVIQTRYGLGLPLKLRSKSAFEDFMIWNYAMRPFYLWGVAGFKLALCLSYLRMTQGTTDKNYRIFIFGVAAFSTLVQTVFVILNLFACSPLSKVFHPQEPGYCLPYGPVNYTISAMTIFCDVVVFFTPIPLINKLKLDRAVKLGLMFIFSLGLFTTLCSILRATQITRIAYGDGNSSMLVMYSALEINVGIITSCLPVLRPFLKHLPRRLLSFLLSTSRGRTGEDASPSNSTPMKSEQRSQKPSTAPPKPRKGSLAHRMFSSNGIERITTTLGGGDSDESVHELQPSSSTRDRSWKGVGVTRTVEIDVEDASMGAEDRRFCNGHGWEVSTSPP